MKLIKNKFLVWGLALLLSYLLYLVVTPRSLYTWLILPNQPVPDEGEKLRLMLLGGFFLLHLLTAFLVVAILRGKKPIQFLSVICLGLNYLAYVEFAGLSRRVLEVYPQHGEKPETPRWNSVCTVDNASIAVTALNISLALEQNGLTPLVTRISDKPQYVALTMPQCRVEQLKIDPAALDIPPTVVAGGVSLLKSGGKWLVLRADGEQWLVPDSSEINQPVLSDDGGWVGWLSRRSERSASPQGAVPVETIDNSAIEIKLYRAFSTDTQVVPLKSAFTDRDISRAELLSIDPKRYEAILSLGDSEFAAVGLDGSLRWGPVRPRAFLGPEKKPVDDVIISRDSFRSIFGGWVAWGRRAGSREQLLSWELPRGAFSIVLDKDSNVTGVTVSPDGRFVAVTQQSPKKERVALYLVREARLLIERNLPQGSLARAAFLGDDYFSYSQIQSAKSGPKGVTYVLELEEEAPFFNAAVASIRLHHKTEEEN